MKFSIEIDSEKQQDPRVLILKLISFTLIAGLWNDATITGVKYIWNYLTRNIASLQNPFQIMAISDSDLTTVLQSNNSEPEEVIEEDYSQTTPISTYFDMLN